MRFTVLALLALGAAASDAKAAGEKNMKTVTKLFGIAGELKNKNLSPEVVQDLQGKLVSFYTPTLKQCAMTPSSSIGFDLIDKSLTECFVAGGTALSGIILTDWAWEVGVVEGSEGKKIFSWASQWDYTVAATGEKVKGVQATVFEFDDDGLVVSFEQLFDTSKFPGVTSLAELAPPATGAAGTVALVAASFSMGAVAMAAFARLTQRKPEPLLAGC
jgi:hypothetical protein